MDIPYLQCFLRVDSFINVQELVQQSKSSNLYDTKYRDTVKILAIRKSHLVKAAGCSTKAPVSHPCSSKIILTPQIMKEYYVLSWELKKKKGLPKQLTAETCTYFNIIFGTLASIHFNHKILRFKNLERQEKLIYLFKVIHLMCIMFFSSECNVF
jgi:hypothetical protein